MFNFNKKKEDKKRNHTGAGNNLEQNRFVGGEVKSLPEVLSAEVLVDVGVAGGTPWLYEAFPNAELILVEPLNVVPTLKDVLKDRDYRLFECAAGSSPGEVEINYVKEKPSLSSILDRTKLTQTRHAAEKKKVLVRPIDDILKEAKCGGKTAGIKIDTEGYELEVLMGAVDTLKNCNFVICEASVEKRFEGSYNFTELVVFMHKQGFILTKVLNFNRDGKGIIRMADVLFQKVDKTN